LPPQFAAPPEVQITDVPKKPRINVRQKGQRGEREVVKLLQDVVDRVRARYAAEPIVLQRNALQAHLGGADLHGLDGFSVEVKFCEQENLGSWWRQTIRQAEKMDGVPVLFYRATRQPWSVKFRAYVQTPLDRELVEMDVETTLEDFLDWFEFAYDERMVHEQHKLQ
jgi:hypothetical protein